MQPWWVLLTRIGPGGQEDLIGVSRTLVDTLSKDTVSSLPLYYFRSIVLI
jgi:hypothetical protein